MFSTPFIPVPHGNSAGRLNPKTNGTNRHRFLQSQPSPRQKQRPLFLPVIVILILIVLSFRGAGGQ